MLRKSAVLSVSLLLTVASVALGAPADLDTSFSGDGRKLIDVGGTASETINRSDYANAVAVQPDGKIVLAGAAQVFASEAPSNEDWAVVRLLPDGRLDPEFDGDGIVTTDLGNVYEAAEDIVLQDGKIVVVGQTHGSAPDQNYTAAVRYDEDGSIDETFGEEGVFRQNMPGSDFGFAGALHEDGIVIAGRYDELGEGMNSFVVRLTHDGDLDSDPTTGFADGGVLTSDMGENDWAHDVSVQGNGKIVVGGTLNWGGLEDPDFYALRLNADGTPDDDSDVTDFGEGGVATVDWNGRSDHANAIALGPRGRVYVGGLTAPDSGQRDVAIAALTRDGELDDSWSGDGRVRTSFPGPSDDGVYELAVESDGKLVAVSFGNGEGFKVARYLPNGQLDPSFGGDGLIIRPMSQNSGGMVSSVALQPNGRIVIGGNAYNENADDFAVMRLRGDKDVSETTLSIDKTAQKITATGKVKPNHAGESVIVKLFKKQDGNFKTVDTVEPVLTATSQYEATFARPNADACKVTVRFNGDVDHQGSSASDLFAC